MAEQSIVCPACQNYIKVQSEWLGMNLQCPSCQTYFTFTANMQSATPFAANPAIYQPINSKVQLDYRPDGQWSSLYEKFEPPATMTTALTKFADFSGRASRSEYWLFQIFLSLISFFSLTATTMFAALDPILGLILMVIMGLAGIYFLIPCISVSVRRLHDINLSGMWCLLCLIPCGSLALFIMAFFPSHPATNRWGQNPNRGKIDEVWPCVVGMLLVVGLPLLALIIISLLCASLV